MTLSGYAGSSQLPPSRGFVAGAPAWLSGRRPCASTCASWCQPAPAGLPDAPAALAAPVNGFLTADMSYALFHARYPRAVGRPCGPLAQEAFLAGNYSSPGVPWWAPAWSASPCGHTWSAAIGGWASPGWLCLVGIFCSLANTRMRVVAALVAGVSAVATYALPLKLNVVVAIAVAVLACLWLEGRLPAAARERVVQ